MKRQPRKPYKLHLDNREIVRARRRGMSLTEIAAPYGVTRQAVSDRLRRHGIPPSPAGRRPRNRSTA